MRTIVFVLAVAAGLGGLLPDDGERDGRRGNDLYNEGSYEAAAEAYASGLAVLSEEAAPSLRYGLNNNLGAALLKSGDAAGALRAFDRALDEAVEDADVARTAYNAGNAAFAEQDLQGALDHYRRSLLRNPENRDAKFNYEFVKRRLDEQQQNQEQQQQQQQDESGEQQNDTEQQDEQQSGEQGQNQQQNQEQQEDGNQQQDAPSPQEGAQEQQAGGTPEGRLSDAQAERILQALQNEEEQLLREVQRPSSRPRQVEKDW